jgi:hypothetical protein
VDIEPNAQINIHQEEGINLFKRVRLHSRSTGGMGDPQTYG